MTLEDMLALLAERVAPEPVYLKSSLGWWSCWVGDLLHAGGSRYRDDMLIGEGRTPRDAVAVLLAGKEGIRV